MKVPIGPRARPLRDGEVAGYLDPRMVERNHEISVTAHFMLDRRLFGECFRRLMPDTYARLGGRSGVMVCGFLPSRALLPEMEFPGDIDLLAIPYDAGNLLISETLAIEVKVVRAKFGKQGKSPNEFGISQARALLRHGFPFAAVAHLIVSDRSPESTWSPVLVGKIVGDDGAVEDLQPARRDLLPSRLIDRSFGRLLKNCATQELGLLASYKSGEGTWFPSARSAKPNPQVSQRTLQAIADYYARHPRHFMDTPKYPFVET